MPVLLVKGNNTYRLEATLKQLGFKTAVREIRYVSSTNLTASRYIGPPSLTEEQLTLVESTFGDDFLGLFSGSIADAIKAASERELAVAREVHGAFVMA